MKVKVSTNRAARIRAGLEPLDLVEFEVPVATCTPDQRDELAQGQTIGGQFGDPVIVDVTLEAILAVLDARAAARRKLKAQEQQRREEQIALWRARPARDWINNPEADPSRFHGAPDLLPHEIFTAPELAERRTEALALLADIRAQYHERVEARNQQRREQAQWGEARDAAREAALRTFAMSSGDPLLIARVKENARNPAVEWKKLARRVYANSVLGQVEALKLLARADGSPEGYTFSAQEARTTPTLDELNLLAAVRQEVADAITCPVTVDLAWLKYLDDETGYILGRCEVIVTVKAPDDTQVDTYFLAP